MLEEGYSRIELTPEAEEEWSRHVADMYSMLLMRNAKSWFTGYNSNVEGKDKTRYLIYNGGAPRYRRWLDECAAEGYKGFVFG